jgi:hypothetical protein
MTYVMCKFPLIVITKHQIVSLKSLRVRYSRASLVHSCQYNKTPEIEQFIKNINLFLTVLETEQPKIKVPSNVVSRESPDSASKLASCCFIFWREQMLLFSCSRRVEASKPTLNLFYYFLFICSFIHSFIF